jgi:hypothetical protein
MSYILKGFAKLQSNLQNRCKIKQLDSITIIHIIIIGIIVGGFYFVFSKMENNIVNFNQTNENNEISLLNKDLYDVIIEFVNLQKLANTKKAYKYDITTFFDKIQINKLFNLGMIPFSEMSKIIMNYLDHYKKDD